MILDLVVITGVVYATGAQDSDFISLYLLAILMGSILFSGRGAFLVASGSFVLLGCVVELAYYGLIPRTAISMPAASLPGVLACDQSVRLPGGCLSGKSAHAHDSRQGC